MTTVLINKTNVSIYQYTPTVSIINTQPDHFKNHRYHYRNTISTKASTVTVSTTAKAGTQFQLQVQEDYQPIST